MQMQDKDPEIFVIGHPGNITIPIPEGVDYMFYDDKYLKWLLNFKSIDKLEVFANANNKKKFL